MTTEAVTSIIPVTFLSAQVDRINWIGLGLTDLLERHSKAKLNAELAFHSAHHIALNKCKVVYQFHQISERPTLEELYSEVSAWENLNEFKAIKAGNPNYSAAISFTHCASTLMPYLLTYYGSLVKMYSIERTIVDSCTIYRSKQVKITNVGIDDGAMAREVAFAININRERYQQLKTGNICRLNRAINDLFGNFYGSNPQPDLELRRMKIISHLDAGMGYISFGYII